MTTRKVEPFAPAPYTDEEARAVKAVSKGQASEEQQRLAMSWIINGACRTYDEPMVPGSPDLTAHLTGRANAGRQIVKLINMSLKTLTKEQS